MQVKTAVLTVSFGTSILPVKTRIIDRIEQRIADAFPDFDHYHAWTSKLIIRKLAKRDHIRIPNVTEAMTELAKRNYDTLIVVPTHISNGCENDWMQEDVLEFSDHFKTIMFTDPLLTSTDDMVWLSDRLRERYRALPSDTALLLMGHGTSHYINPLYAGFDYMCKERGFVQAYVGCVESYPYLEQVIPQLQKAGYKKVHLLPLMLVAGVHAHDDMAGNEADSWKQQLQKAGFTVTYDLVGLGDDPTIQEYFVQRIHDILCDDTECKV
ncbi:MAG: sirohydrochlorin cobaltochelatase [Lachnospiraceae bacterium]|nr:sirohydrochlorin cobaltochelatase [Lachnospiraceae bacterium]MDY5742459.1 sirohydrochlorin cobaltochelatase [Lachnospiraceae bacterium]